MDIFSSSPSSFAKIISWGAAASVGTAVQDLNTFIDCTPFDYLHIIVVNAALGTGTTLTLKLRHADDSAGSTNVAFAQDAAAADISLAVATTARTASFQVRTRGLRKFVSPTIVDDAGTTGAGTIVMVGIGVRDSSEVPALSTLLAAGTYA